MGKIKEKKLLTYGSILEDGVIQCFCIHEVQQVLIRNDNRMAFFHAASRLVGVRNFSHLLVFLGNLDSRVLKQITYFS